ncbi:uncharacterized protein BDV17DRAFT_82144 [Aspergillus undulatus]|uniref:uncharacterized protein n=1 Tax=Aspergillus undulatus TaxID=1810928 RepID=UPI003CCCA911
MTSIGVAIYTPSDSRDPSHWALWLKTSNGESVILQVHSVNVVTSIQTDYRTSQGNYDRSPVSATCHESPSHVTRPVLDGTAPARCPKTATEKMMSGCYVAHCYCRSMVTPQWCLRERMATLGS